MVDRLMRKVYVWVNVRMTAVSDKLPSKSVEAKTLLKQYRLQRRYEGWRRCWVLCYRISQKLHLSFMDE